MKESEVETVSGERGALRAGGGGYDAHRDTHERTHKKTRARARGGLQFVLLCFQRVVADEWIKMYTVDGGACTSRALNARVRRWASLRFARLD